MGDGPLAPMHAREVAASSQGSWDMAKLPMVEAKILRMIQPLSMLARTHRIAQAY